MRWPGWLTTSVFFAALLAGWQLASTSGLVSALQLPPPSVLAATAVDIMRTGYPSGVPLWVHVLSSLRLAVSGYLIGASIALIIALPIAWYGPLRDAATPVIDLFRGIPGLAWVPLAIALFGIGDASKLFVVVYGTFWTTLTYSVDGLVRVDPTLVRVGGFCGASSSQLMRTVLLPAALPTIFIGLRVAYAIAFAIVLSAEMIGSFQGLGYMIMDARGIYRMDVVFVGVVTIGLIAYATSRLLSWLERKALRWRPPAEGVVVYEA